AQAELLDEGAVALDVDAPQVTLQAATLADQEEQTTTAVVVVLVLLQVLGEVLDALREQRDLHLGRAGVARLGPVLGNDLLLRGSVERHGSPSVSLRGAPGLLHRGALDPRPFRRRYNITSGQPPRPPPRDETSGTSRGSRAVPRRVPDGRLSVCDARAPPTRRPPQRTRPAPRPASATPSPRP